MDATTLLIELAIILTPFGIAGALGFAAGESIKRETERKS